MGSYSPSITGERLVNFDANVVASNGGAPISYNRSSNTCTLTCHETAHNSDGTVSMRKGQTTGRGRDRFEGTGTEVGAKPTYAERKNPIPDAASLLGYPSFQAKLLRSLLKRSLGGGRKFGPFNAPPKVRALPAVFGPAAD